MLETEKNFKKNTTEPSEHRSLSANDAERALLGSVLSDGDIQAEIFGGVSGNPFQDARHNVIWELMRSLSDRGEIVDIVNLSAAMEDQGQSVACGGTAYLARLLADAAAPANYRAYLRILREKFLLSRLNKSAMGLQQRVVSAGGGDAESIIAWMDDQIQTLANDDTMPQGPVRVSEMLPDIVNDIEHASSNKQTVTGTPTGFEGLDERLSGLHPGQLIVLAARPSMGKTALAMNIAEHVAIDYRNAVLEKMKKNEKKSGQVDAMIKDGKGPGVVLVFSLEMPARELVLRMLASRGSVNQHRIRSGTLSNDDWAKIASGAGGLNMAPIYIEDNPMSQVSSVRAAAKKLQRERGLSLIIIDYLQLMLVAGRSGNRASEVSDVSRALKLLAKELQVPVIALSQLNRAVEQRTDKRPMMSDLRESGSIEQDADVVMMLYRQEVYEKDKEEIKGQAEVNIVKQRNGQIGMTRMVFQGEYSRFMNPESGTAW